MSDLFYIEIFNDQSLFTIEKHIEDKIAAAVKECLLHEGIDRKCQIDIQFTDNNKIRLINNQYRHIDKATDVLSFPITTMEDGKIISAEGDLNLDSGVLLLGDIIISVEKAGEQAYKYGHSFEREILFLITHGVYHLLGYNHNENDNTMIDRQEEILKRVWNNEKSKKDME